MPLKTQATGCPILLAARHQSLPSIVFRVRWHRSTTPFVGGL